MRKSSIKIIITLFLMAAFIQGIRLHACSGYGNLSFLLAGSNKYDKTTKQYNNFYAVIRDTKDFIKLEFYDTYTLRYLDEKKFVFTKEKGYTLGSWFKKLAYELIKNANAIFNYHENIDIYFSPSRKRDKILGPKYYKVYYQDPSIEEKTIVRQLSTEIFNLNTEEKSLLTKKSAFTQENWRVYSRQQTEKQIKIEREREKERLRLKKEREEEEERQRLEKEMEKERELRQYFATWQVSFSL